MDLDTIYNEDCLKGLERLYGMDIPLIVTDPPYEVITQGGGTINNTKGLSTSLKALDDLSITNGYDIKALARHVSNIQGENINIYLWCNKTQIPEYFDTYVTNLNCKFDLILWHKTNALPTYSNKYLSDTEYCLHFYKGKGMTHPNTYEDATTYYLAPINASDKKLWEHPTIKPVDIIQRLIRNSSKVGDVVLDPFMGSGTTAVASIREERHFIGFEIDQTYYDKSRQRIDAERRNRLFTQF